MLEMRRKRGWSLRALTVRSGVAPATISDIERGAAVPETGTLLKLAASFGVTLDELAGVERDEDDAIVAEVGSFVSVWRELSPEDRELAWQFLQLLEARRKGGELGAPGAPRAGRPAKVRKAKTG